MILSWSRTRLQRANNDANSSFFEEERKKALAVLRSYGVVYSDSEWPSFRDRLWGLMLLNDAKQQERITGIYLEQTVYYWTSCLYGTVEKAI
ncbi:hypothetical protein NUU61_004817 [Penicillium alfredii]|uniref:Uncharacterized protein n=1 Tax=Penicillium alfredii TaxID=1506179 RepID=A0A9W9K7M1_9EURO|nr:uncharacterized protein NUU61_004817 [Penicillium alfredii]KAJ5095461.1 hypothetical protein NUU61_004817 [Penicillium alfredii]